jgi:hypothetical protein
MNKLKLGIAALFVVASVQAAFSQASVSLGIKGGLNFANVNSTSVGAAFDSRTGYHAGAFVSIKMTKIAIQPEVIFSQQGSTVKISGTSFDSNFSYVNIPVMLKFYVVSGLNLQVGPQFGFLTSSTGPDPSGSGTLVDYKNYLKSSDISVGLGAGFDISKFSIDARYNLGISEINDNASISAAKNQVFQLSLGFKLFEFGN